MAQQDAAGTLVVDVPHNGYAWDDGPTEDMQHMAPYLIPVPSFGPTSYVPLRDRPNLFFDFAQTPLTREGIRQFANRHGNLTSGTQVRTTMFSEGIEGEMGILTPPLAADRSYETTGVPWSEWIEQGTSVRYLVNLWKWIEGDNKIMFSNAMHWRDDHWLIYRLGDDEDMVNAHSIPWDESPQPGGKIRQGFLFPSQFPGYTSALAEADRAFALSCVLRHELNRAMLAATFRLSLEPVKSGRIRATPVPVDLISCIWLQFARVVSGETETRLRADGKYEVIEDVKSSDPEYTHRLSADRSRNYRRRVQDTLQKFRDGVPLETIKQEMASQGVKNTSVEKWLEDAKLLPRK